MPISRRKITHPYNTGKLPVNTLLKQRYLIVRCVAQGGMSAIYLATDTQIFGEKWAVKEISYQLASGSSKPDAAFQADLRRNFEGEFRLLQKASHPNLPKVHDFFEEQGRLYIVMEFIAGQTLEYIRGNLPIGTFLPQARVLTWVRQLCDVLQYLHSQDPPIIYRDLKPSNVMEMAGSDRIKLIDFGIARFYKPGKRADTLHFGTEGYLAPEVYSNLEQSSPRSDVYALGVLTYELLTNRDPLMTPYNFPPVTTINTAVSPTVESALQKALHLKPDQRIQSMQDLATELFGAPILYPPKPIAPPSPLTLAPAPQSPLPLTVSARSLHLDGVVNHLIIQAPVGQYVSTYASEPWLDCEPDFYLSNGSPCTLSVTSITADLEPGEWQPPARWTWYTHLPRPVQWWLNVHTRSLIGGPRLHQAQIVVNATGQSPIGVAVDLQVTPSPWRVRLGWIIVLILLILETSLLISPLVYVASQLFS